MFDDSELDRIRSRRDELASSMDERAAAIGRSSTKRFVLSISCATALLAVVIVAGVVGNVGAVVTSDIGGITLRGEKIVGNDIELYPYPAETSACYSNVSDPRAGLRSNVSTGALKGDISQLIVPADKQIRITKDIRLPKLPLEVLRIELERTDLATNPSYPPVAGTTPAVGEVPDSLIGSTAFAGITAGTGSNEGYADLTFKRTRNITPAGAPTLSVRASADYDYSRTDPSTYVFTRGSDANRYVDDVSIQSLSSANTGDDGGYGVFVDESNAPNNVSTGASTTLTVDATTEGAFFGDVDTNAYADADGRNTAQHQIDDVVIDAGATEVLNNSGTDGEFGYGDYTNIATDPNVSKSDEVSVTVRGDKYTTAFGWSNTPSGYSDTSDSSNNACHTGDVFGDDDCASVLDVEMNGIDRNSGDDNGYYPDSPPPQQTSTPLEPGSQVPLTVEVQASDDDQAIDTEEDSTISISKTCIDWDRDGTFQEDEEFFTGGVSAINGGVETTRNTVNVFVPRDAKYGSTVMRVVNAMNYESSTAPDATYPCSADAGNYNIDHIEKEDYTVDVTPRNEVVAWIDWDHDRKLASDERIRIGTSLDKTGRYDYTTTFGPRADALSGSTLMRIQQYNGRRQPNPAFGCCNTFNGTVEDYTFRLQQNLNSAVHALVDWDQNGQFDLTEREREDFDFSFLSGWTVSGSAGAAQDFSNSDTYSVNVSAGSGNTLTSPTLDTSNVGAIRLSFWIARGSNDVNNLPEGGEDIVVEYLDDTGTWQEVRTVRANNFEPGGTRIVEEAISAPDALHSGFQVRFRGNGDGTSGFDWWSIDDPAISTTDEVQRIDTSTLIDGEYTAQGGLIVPPDAKSGSTLMRIIHQQDGYVGSFPALARVPPTGFQGEAEDYTLHVERGTSFVRAWVDWDRDGFLTDQSPIDVGQQSAPGNVDGFTVSTTVSPPAFSGSGPAVVRVKHEQVQRSTDLTGPTVEGFRGENEDYTAILSQTTGDISDTGNLTLGDSSIVLTRLRADDIVLRDTLIDEDYSDNTLENPRFGPSGEFTLGGDRLQLINATGVIHYVDFSTFTFNDLRLDVEFITDPGTTDTRNKTANVCQPLGDYAP